MPLKKEFQDKIGFQTKHMFDNYEINAKEILQKRVAAIIEGMRNKKATEDEFALAPIIYAAYHNKGMINDLLTCYELLMEVGFDGMAHKGK